MFNRLLIIATALCAMTAGSSALAQSPVGSTVSFHQQTDLQINSQSLDGLFDLRLTVFDSESGGNQIGNSKKVRKVEIDSGQVAPFDVNLGSGVFNGEARWIQFEAKPSGGNGFTLISPRVKVRPVAYAQALPGLRTEENESSPNVIGGFSGNSVEPEDFAVTISGGGFDGSPNQAFDSAATIGGGFGNTTSGDTSTIAGGARNTAIGGVSAIGGGSDNESNGDFSTVGGGDGNVADGTGSTVGGGLGNTASGLDSTVAGGDGNLASGVESAIGGGDTNEATGDESVIGGGCANEASGSESVIGGGAGNRASGSGATVPGGFSNVAGGTTSVAAGNRAKALHNGAFIWADSTNADFSSVADNYFGVRCSGGAQIFSNAGLTTGVELFPGGNSWSGVSDRNVKENFEPIDTRDILKKVCAIPITEWNLISQDDSIRHIGPMAQDFKAAFGLGEDDRHISSSDADGVALAAIQGLNVRIDQLQEENEELRRRLAAIEARIPSVSEPAFK